ncbi:hypothetical protein AAEU41_07175 [Pantoea agglomerans]|nr:hypothetical protein PGS1_07195 [Enterobacter cloacae subsp. cloacae GS1]
MKGYVLILCGLMVAFNASAGRITMSNPVQTTTENGIILCVYSNNVYTFVYKTRSKHCPYSKSFDTSDSE